jgi:hypothetical protein
MSREVHTGRCALQVAPKDAQSLYEVKVTVENNRRGWDGKNGGSSDAGFLYILLRGRRQSDFIVSKLRLQAACSCKT